MKKDNPIFNQVVRWAAGIAIIALAGFMTSAKPYPKPLKVKSSATPNSCVSLRSTRTYGRILGMTCNGILKRAME